MEDATSLALNYKECSQEGSSLYFSGYSGDLSWGVRCVTKEQKQSCSNTTNSNWKEYSLSYGGILKSI